jgi:hypothetical protein
MTFGQSFSFRAVLLLPGSLMHLFCRGVALTSHNGSFDEEHTLKKKYSQIKNLMGILFEKMETFWR